MSTEQVFAMGVVAVMPVAVCGAAIVGVAIAIGAWTNLLEELRERRERK